MKFYKILIIFAALAMTSCDDFLDVQPVTEKVESDMFSDAQGFEDAIYGVYASLQSTSLYGRELMWGTTEILAQNIKCDGSWVDGLSQYIYDENSSVISTIDAIWTNAYQVIGYANNVIKNLEGHSTQSLSRYNLYMGEMLGMRAVLHFDMLRLFAPINEDATGIPYVTAYSQEVKPFYTVGQVYDYIITDLLEAEKLLTADEKLVEYPRNNTNYNAFENYRETHMNLYAVRAYLARVYWMRGDMTNAAKYAESVINSQKFPLVDVTEVQDYLTGVLSPKETIFGVFSPTAVELAISYLYDHLSYSSYDPYNDASGVTHLLPFDAVYKKDVPDGVQDYRTYHFPLIGTSTYRFWKLVDYYEASDTKRSTTENLIKGFTLIHASEMYLIAAEALLDTDYNQAVAYFDAEIQSRGLAAFETRGVTLTKEMIYNEYHKELFGEGQVWFNMKRLNKDIQSNEELRIIPASNDIYVLPIPDAEYDYRTDNK